MNGASLPRGIRNHNPGNLRWGSPWLGLVPESDRTDPDFCQFVDGWCGLRALGITLLNYRRRYHLATIAEIIGHWAPANENDTAAYINSVVEATGFAAMQRLPAFDADTLMNFAGAITRHENGAGPRAGGTWYPDYSRHAAADAALDYMVRNP